MKNKLKFTERDLLNQVKDYLRIKGIFFWRNHQSLGSQKGIPDLMCLHKGEFYAFELKAPKGKLSEYQKEFILVVNQCGGVAKEIKSLEEIIEVIK